MSHIDIQNDNEYAINSTRLITAIQTVINCHDVASDSAVTVVFTTDDAVHALNRQHRDVDAATDILSFPADPLPPELADSEAIYLGDLIIAYPYASSQAARLKHSLDDSLTLLVIHGTLHLLGYDHNTPETRAEMWAEQAAVLQSLGIDDTIVPSLEGSEHD